MEGSCSTGQSPQWAVVPVEEEEEEEEEKRREEEEEEEKRRRRRRRRRRMSWKGVKRSGHGIILLSRHNFWTNRDKLR
jgi:hypothetical protein